MFGFHSILVTVCAGQNQLYLNNVGLEIISVSRKIFE